MDPRKLARTISLTGLAVVLLTAGARSIPSSPQEEDHLKQRVEAFYSLLLNNRLADAEAYIARESVENFRRLQNNPFVGFEVKTAHLDEKGTSAEVETMIFFVAPGAPQPLPFPRKTNWQLEDGEWRQVLSFAPPPNLIPGRGLLGGKAAETPKDLQFVDLQLNLGIVYKDERPQARFSFKNMASHPVRIELETGCECLVAMKDDKAYAPGETGEVVIEFDPSGYMFFYKQAIVVRTLPSGNSHLISIEAQVLPPESRPTEPE